MRPKITLSKLLFACTFMLICISGYSQTIVNTQITTAAADSGDDAEERLSDGVMDLTSSDLELCRDSDGDQLVGLRFQGVNVPHGAVVSNCYIQFDVDTATSGAVTVDITGIDVDNAAQFNTTDYNISDRIDGDISYGTTSIVSWSIPDWPTVGDNGVNQRTIDISALVQEIIDRPGWISGNDMGFVFSPNSGSPNYREPEDGDNASHVLSLHVEYIASPAAEMDVYGNSNSIPDGTTVVSLGNDTDYGSSNIGTPVAHTFTIQNNGGTNLTVTNPVITGHTTDFTVTANPTSPIGSGGNTTFTVTFNPTVAGTRSATVTIANNDSDENPYIFNIEGEGVLPLPEINVTGNGNTIDSGKTNLTITDDTKFSGTTIGIPVFHTFTIQNTGTATLNLTGGGTLVQISGDPQFSVTTQPTGATITPTGSRTFTVRYIPSTTGLARATITIPNDDSDENPYIFNIGGAINIINSGSVWSYLDDGSNQGTAWYGTGFNYAAWLTGATEIGYGDGGEATVLTTPPNPKPATVYFRKSFTITATDIASVHNTLILNAIRDDGMVVYINGVEVWKDNMPGTVAFNTFATSTVGGAGETTWITHNIENPFTIPGTYEIGVEIHQVSATSSDISFDFEMYSSNNLLSSDGLWSYLDDGSDQGTAWQTADVTPTGANWATGNAQLGFGDGDETTVVADNDQITTYFRKTINATGTDIINSTLKISTVRDDGIVIYINGTEILRNNMPVGIINYNTLAVGDVTRPTENFEDFWNVFKISNPLVAGINEIAVEIHQITATDDDISFNLELETNNDVIYVPTVKPDRDNDGREDYVDADDDNDGISDLVEGCNTTLPATLETDGDGETDIKGSLPITTALNDGNSITYSVNNSANFNALTAYDAGEHGYGLKMGGPITNGELTLTFTNNVKNLFFKLVDFDGHEVIKVDVYDEFGVIVDLTLAEGLYHLGSYVEYLGSNTISEIYNGAAPNINNPENRAHDIYGGAYFYFPNINVSRVTFTANWASSNTIRLAGVQYCSKDTDGDGIDDFYDSDSDNDGIPDLVEVGGTDTNGDGIVDSFTDADYDGITALYDSDDNSYFIEELGTLTNLDFDGDGVRNNVDLDADNDGILDILEAGGTDANGDGQIDGFTDANDDGYHDAFDGAGSQLITGADTDADGQPNSYAEVLDNPDSTGLPNFLDIDSDDDGITDHTEAQGTTATYVAYGGADSDGDGILDVNDNFVGFAGNGFTPVNSDVDGIPDYLDTNSDNHGELDIVEGHDTNGDGTVDSSDWGTCLNSITSNLGALASADTDGDGLDDGFDNDLGTYDPSNMGIQATSHPNIDDIATAERDWREPDQDYNVIDFDGFNDYIDFADNHDLTSSFTIETWIKEDPTSTGNGMLIAKRDCNKGTNLGYSLSLVNHFPNIKWYNNLGVLVFDLTSSYAIGTDRWYSISVTYDTTTTTAKIYIDGIEVASNSSVSSAPSANDESLLVGAKFDDTDLSQKLSNEFEGWIDEIRIWDTALTVSQIREMMNQEIQQNGTAVQGKILSNDIAGLNWSNLLGYYPLNSISAGFLNDESSNSANGRIRNILTTQPQTAPLPYTTVRDGEWTDNTASTPWSQGSSVWSHPDAVGIDGSTIIDWNIVVTSHDITSGDKDITVLGLIADTPGTTLTIADPVEPQDETNSGQSLRVTHYLEMDGDIDLVGESQLLQDEGSVLATSSAGSLQRDQQGTQDLYTYNYWCSPVGLSNTSTNNTAFNLNNNILRNGTLSATPNDITFTSNYDGSISGTDIDIADYWIWKYADLQANNYASWQHVRSSGLLNVGEGFTMKGVESSMTSHASTQNYVFEGKPNNGDITLSITAGNEYLVGNPYPSALDADEFIKDNISNLEADGRNTSGNVINGVLYFWDHFASGTHILSDYQGGYATYTLMGGAVAISNDALINANGTIGTTTPGRYVPVGQGFFVSAILDIDLNNDGEDLDMDMTPDPDPNDPALTETIDGGNLIFKNSQRVFQREGTAASLFVKSGKTKNKNSVTKNANNDERQKIKLMLDSPDGYHRQLLVGVDEKCSNNFDMGYDAPLIETNKEDMYWVFNNANFVIQAVNNFNQDQVLPLGLKINKAGIATIKIDAIENVAKSTKIIIHDKELNTFKDLSEGNFETYLERGEYNDRFELVFANSLLLSSDDIEQSNLNIYFANDTDRIVIHNPESINIKEVELYNIIGQSVNNFKTNSNKTLIEHHVKQIKAGIYIIKLHTENKTISKKILIK